VIKPPFVFENHPTVDVLPRQIVEDYCRLAGHGTVRALHLESLETGDDLVGELRRGPAVARGHSDHRPRIAGVEQSAHDQHDLVGVGSFDLVARRVEKAKAVARIAQQVGVVFRLRAGR